MDDKEATRYITSWKEWLETFDLMDSDRQMEDFLIGEGIILQEELDELWKRRLRPSDLWTGNHGADVEPLKERLYKKWNERLGFNHFQFTPMSAYLKSIEGIMKELVWED